MLKIKLKNIIPVIIGGVLGYAYYYFIGCNNGCAITGDPYISSIYGALVGLVVAIPSKKNQNDTKNNKTN